jgi:hypothetical protein
MAKSLKNRPKIGLIALTKAGTLGIFDADFARANSFKQVPLKGEITFHFKKIRNL